MPRINPPLPVTAASSPSSTPAPMAASIAPALEAIAAAKASSPPAIGPAAAGALSSQPGIAPISGKATVGQSAAGIAGLQLLGPNAALPAAMPAPTAAPPVAMPPPSDAANAALTPAPRPTAAPPVAMPHRSNAKALMELALSLGIGAEEAMPGLAFIFSGLKGRSAEQSLAIQTCYVKGLCEALVFVTLKMSYCLGHDKNWWPDKNLTAQRIAEVMVDEKPYWTVIDKETYIRGDRMFCPGEGGNYYRNCFCWLKKENIVKWGDSNFQYWQGKPSEVEKVTNEEISHTFSEILFATWKMASTDPKKFQSYMRSTVIEIYRALIADEASHLTDDQCFAKMAPLCRLRGLPWMGDSADISRLNPEMHNALYCIYEGAESTPPSNWVISVPGRTPLIHSLGKIFFREPDAKEVDRMRTLLREVEAHQANAAAAAAAPHPYAKPSSRPGDDNDEKEPHPSHNASHIAAKK